jgi:hypothetical protein
VIHQTAFRQGAPGWSGSRWRQFAEGGEIKVRDYDAFLRAASEPERAVRDASSSRSARRSTPRAA